MSRSKSKSSYGVPTETVAPVPVSVQVPRSQSLAKVAGAFFCGVALSVLIGSVVWPYAAVASRHSISAPAKLEPAAAEAKPVTDPELWRAMSMSDEQLASVDIAYLNLLCATGLPGSESLNLAACRQTLDMWTELIRQQTEKYLYKFQQHPEEYENKEGYYRMLMLVTVLQQDLGVHYNTDRIENVDFTKSQDLFIHGMIGSQNGGTCVSMPVLYTAVARRLGYPVKLVVAKGHVFCRWDTASERFNIEGAGVGMNSHSDEHYQTWPQPLSAAEIKNNVYLRSLTPREELAVFMAARGHCLQDTGRSAESYVAYAHAHELDPQLPETLGFLREAVRGTIDRPAMARQNGQSSRRGGATEFDDLRWTADHMRQLSQEQAEMRDQQQAYQQRLWNSDPLLPSNAASPFADPNQNPSFPLPQ